MPTMRTTDPQRAPRRREGRTSRREGGRMIDVEDCEACGDETPRYDDSGRCVPCALRACREAILKMRKTCSTCGNHVKGGRCLTCRREKLARLYRDQVPCAACGGIFNRFPSGACRGCQLRAKVAA
jgi:hypothetical protein